MKQKTAFLESEGDAYWKRNAAAAASRQLPEDDSALMALLEIPRLSADSTVLEIGCGEASRLSWLRENRGMACCGVEPSAWAVSAARERNIDVRQGTADRLPFDDGKFDVVIFGWCLYLCDREDLFRIAYEADRVLKDPGWLLILEYFNPAATKREYHHRPGVFSYKMDYRKLFTWHPGYTEFYQKTVHFVDGDYTDDRDAWAATAVLRKNMALNQFPV